MNADGSCPCECECADGSMDGLDAEGNCPCECECKCCQQSKMGPEGCICPDDTCPICEPERTPRWVNCMCTCDTNECGYNSTCAQGRKGRNCDQPSCPACESCSGNGVCMGITGSCASSCSCFPRWTGGMYNSSFLKQNFFLQKIIFFLGACCEIPDPPPFFGDPHLETMDGVSFDYFGIGQFWFCLSPSNDFGIQTRFFYFGQTSFTGAVALKIGNSVLTMTTPPVGPVLR